MSDSEPILFVVDDELDARQSIAALASSLGIKCETFASAGDFLERFEVSLAGCLLIDLVLEGITGLELQERLAEMDSTLPVILISAFADVPVTVRAMQNGALTVLEKPYRANELADAIQKAFRVNRHMREASAQSRQLERRIGTLSARERRVMELVLADKPNRVIAADLGAGRRTVDRIRSTMLEKMGVLSLVELAQRVAVLRAAEEARNRNRFCE